MIFSIALIVFILFYLFINYIQSSVGLYPKLARNYPANIEFQKTSMLRQTEIHLVKESQFSESNKDMEYRPWLNIVHTEHGLCIQQTKSLILLFPKNCLIPWQNIKFIEKQTALIRDKYVFEISLDEENIYLISKKDILEKNKIS
ncbi:hypothetical protein [Pseudoalteromonas sp. RB2-MNA-CIBAN-0110]|uniref:hypothetical protein n=1 Tax=Pseudoalteromonas sp. RB2-MNA-CIBAN-0110 TaxID=3140439 RepID=UPI003333DD55